VGEDNVIATAVEFLKQWGALVLATIALIQPWCMQLWRSVFRQGSIDIYKTGTIEIGYSTFGPTIGLHGTLCARDRDLFVANAKLTVLRVSDNATHHFEWAAFRPAVINLTRPIDNIALPAGFMLTVQRPQRFNIFFNDTGQQQEMATVIETLRAAWWAAVRAALPGGLPQNPTAVQQQINQAAQAAYPAFQSAPAHVAAFTGLDQLFYWTAGQYRLALTVETVRPNRSFPKGWNFQLTAAQSQNLRLNPIKIVQDTCGQAVGQYEFAYAAYQEVNV
jgi:hypothetical protein